MSNLKMNCGYCGRKCSLDKDFCIPQDSVYICKSCYDWEQKVDDLEAKLAESEKNIEHWHKLYNERDKQFQSVRQRYHLLNKLQSNYDKKDKLHLAYMQCAELVDENNQLKQQLAEKGKRTAIRTIEILKTVSSKTYENASDGSEHIIAWLFTPMDVKETLEYINREKFEFKTENQKAIEELEKVIEFAKTQDEFGFRKSGMEIFMFIDQQIKSLKGEK